MNNKIIALSIVSASDIAVVKPDFTYNWTISNPKDFQDILHEFGMDVTSMWEVQDDVIHTTRMNKVVQCTRYVGSERTDKEWINSGYASREAKDKSSGSKLLNDIYRGKGMTE